MVVKNGETFWIYAYLEDCSLSGPKRKHLLLDVHNSSNHAQLHSVIGHFTVVGLVTKTLSECEAEVDLVFIQTSFLF